MTGSLKKIPVVYYHSIGPVAENWNRNFLTTTAEVFEEHLKYYKKNHTIISLSDYYNIRKGALASPEKPLVITIDDGYLDNWIWAYPLLKKYDLKASIFVIPEMVNPERIVRPNLEDFMNGKAGRKDLTNCGYMSWDEMNLMEQSGIIDIQSHTMTHAKYFVSDKIINFHHPGADCLYPVGNLYPEKKPFHIANPEFEALMPFGAPFFEEKSSVIAKKVKINPDFVNECIEVLKTFDFTKYDFESVYKKIEQVYVSYKKDNKIITERESREDFLKRINYEIVESKNQIEKKLSKKVEFLCWPHGDNSEEVHEIAIKNGYKATTIGNLKSNSDSADRISKRIGYRPYFNSSRLGFMRLAALIKETEGSNSGRLLAKLYRKFKT